jgi:hypothetical protein
MVEIQFVGGPVCVHTRAMSDALPNVTISFYLSQVCKQSIAVVQYE